MTGFNLPPGCSVRDIDRAAGADQPDPTPESNHVADLLEKHVAAMQAGPECQDPDDVRVWERARGRESDAIVAIVDDLAQDRNEALLLLAQAVTGLPSDDCICNPRPGATGGPTYEAMHQHNCPQSVHDYGELTLREEIGAFITKKRDFEE